MAGGGAAGARSFLETPTFAIAIVILVFVGLTWIIEHSLHRLKHTLHKHKKHALVHIVDGMVMELMLLGLFSLLLSALQDSITDIKVNFDNYDRWLIANRVSSHGCASCLYRTKWLSPAFVSQKKDNYKEYKNKGNKDYSECAWAEPYYKQNFGGGDTAGGHRRLLLLEQTRRWGYDLDPTQLSKLQAFVEDLVLQTEDVQPVEAGTGNVVVNTSSVTTPTYTTLGPSRKLLAPAAVDAHGDEKAAENKEYGAEAAEYGAEDEEKESLLSGSALHAIHILVFVVAVTHIVTVLIIGGVARFRIKSWYDVFPEKDDMRTQAARRLVLCYQIYYDKAIRETRTSRPVRDSAMSTSGVPSTGDYPSSNDYPSSGSDIVAADAQVQSLLEQVNSEAASKAKEWDSGQRSTTLAKLDAVIQEGADGTDGAGAKKQGSGLGPVSEGVEEGENSGGSVGTEGEVHVPDPESVNYDEVAVDFHGQLPPEGTILSKQTVGQQTRYRKVMGGQVREFEVSNSGQLSFLLDDEDSKVQFQMDGACDKGGPVVLPQVVNIQGTNVSATKKADALNQEDSKFWDNVKEWGRCLVYQFTMAVTKAEYQTGRASFILTHKQGENFKFHEYLQEVFQEDYSKVVGINFTMWILIMCIIFLSGPAGWLSQWLQLINIFIVLIVTAKLEKVLRHATAHGNIKQLNDNVFWFNKPERLLPILKFAMYFNSFMFAEMIFFAWQFGGQNCHFYQSGWRPWSAPWYVILIVNILLMAHLAINTLPLYVLSTQMGTTYKAHLLSTQVRNVLLTNLKRIRKAKKEENTKFTTAVARRMSQMTNTSHDKETSGSETTAAS